MKKTANLRFQNRSQCLKHLITKQYGASQQEKKKDYVLPFFSVVFISAV